MAHDALEISNYQLKSLSNEVEVGSDGRASYRGPFLIARLTLHDGHSEYRKGKMTVQGASENGEFSVRLAQMAPVIGEGEYFFVGDKYLETSMYRGGCDGISQSEAPSKGYCSEAIGLGGSVRTTDEF